MLIKPLFPGAQQYPKHNWVSSAYQIIWLHRQSRVTRNKMIIKVCPPSFLIFTNLTCSNDHYSNNLKISSAQIDPWLSEWLDLMSRYCQLSKNARMIYFSQSEALRRLHQPIRSNSFVERTHKEIRNRDRSLSLTSAKLHWPSVGQQRIKWTMFCLELSPNVKCSTS